MEIKRIHCLRSNKVWIVLIAFILSLHYSYAQEETSSISGTIFEAGTGKPLRHAMVAVSGTPQSVISDSLGQFNLKAEPDAALIINLPGYDSRVIYVNNQTNVEVGLVANDFVSLDDNASTPLGAMTIKDKLNPVDFIPANEMNKLMISSVDQALQGKSSGLWVTGMSGMPGHRNWLSIRGLTSIYGNNEPMLVIDGMIHETQYINSSSIEGYVINPYDVIDIDDIEDITILKNGAAYYGSRAANGILNINTEQRREASTAINVHVYQGVSTPPSPISMLDRGQYLNLLNDQISSQNLSGDQVDALFPWLNGGENAPEYERYNNNTNWQDEIFKSGYVQKYHIFLKGGDDIATYNISTGYLRHGGVVKNTYYSRYNLRLNGRINLTNKLSVSPNAKISLSDSYLMEQGPNQVSNPILAASLKPPIMKPNATDPNTNEETKFLDDIGVFDVSNPSAIVKELDAQSRNYHLLSSVKANLELTPKLSVSSVVGLDFNNSRDYVFIPDKGLARIDSANNSARVMVVDYRSFQNHNEITYTSKFGNNNNLSIKAGHRVMKNTYEWDKRTDLNAATDDFRSLGKGAEYGFLRTTLGESWGLNWVSYFMNVDYNFRDKYYLNINSSYEGNSLLNENNRYNLFYMVSGAWRLISGTSSSSMFDDLKLRASWGTSGILHNHIYHYSRLYYRGRRLSDEGVLIRESIPNADLEVEQKSTLDVGIDLAALDQTLNIKLDYYTAMVNNLIILQELPPAVGYKEYYSNGGELTTSGLEFSVDFRKYIARNIFMVGANVANPKTEIKNLNFIYDPDNKDYILYPVEGGEIITKVGEPMFSFYGYETNGVYASGTEASQVTGPNGAKGKEGDIKFVDRDGNNVIDDNDKTVIGNPNPTLFGGLYLSFSLRNNLTIRADMSYCVGNKIYNYYKRRTQAMDNYYNQHDEVTDRYTSSNSGNEMPRAAFGDPFGNAVFSDRWIEDGSYLKLNQITVSYDMPPNTKFWKSMTIYAAASNLLTLSGYSGYYPEFMYTNDPIFMGIDYGKIPFNKSFILGVKLGL